MYVYKLYTNHIQASRYRSDLTIYVKTIDTYNCVKFAKGCLDVLIDDLLFINLNMYELKDEMNSNA